MRREAAQSPLRLLADDLTDAVAVQLQLPAHPSASIQRSRPQPVTCEGTAQVTGDPFAS